jgi:hypothetical protein
MSAKTTKPGALALPLYASKPQRTITDTGVVAVTTYRSGDGTLRTYSIFDAKGTHLGVVTNHMARLAQSAGYHIGSGSYDARRMMSFRNLAEVGTYLEANPGATGKEA